MKKIIFISVATVLSLPISVSAMGEKRFTKESELRSECERRNSDSKPYRYFEGTFTKGHLFAVPHMPEPTANSHKTLSVANEPATYISEFANNQQTFSIFINDDRSKLEKYNFEAGKKYAACITEEKNASKNNNREIWMIDNLNLIKKMEI